MLHVATLRDATGFERSGALSAHVAVEDMIASFTVSSRRNWLPKPRGTPLRSIDGTGWFNA